MARQNNVICTQLSKDSGLIKAIVAIDTWQNQILTPFATGQNDDFLDIGDILAGFWLNSAGQRR
jgi:hypothetical protein